MLGRHRHRIEIVVVLELVVAAHHLAGAPAVDPQLLVGESPAEDRLICLEERLGQLRVWLQRSESHHHLHHPLGVTRIHRPEGGDQALDFRIGESLEEAEVEEGDPAVGEEQGVARMRVAVQQPVAQGPVDVEADEDLAEPVALGLAALQGLGEALALDEVADDHPLAAERR